MVALTSPCERTAAAALQALVKLLSGLPAVSPCSAEAEPESLSFSLFVSWASSALLVSEQWALASASICSKQQRKKQVGEGRGSSPHNWKAGKWGYYLEYHIKTRCRLGHQSMSSNIPLACRWLADWS